MIRRMALSDVERATQLYMEYIPDSFLKTFGREFIGFLLKGVISSQYGFPYVYLANGKIVGFIVAASNQRALLEEFLKRYGLAVCRFIFCAFVRCPRVIKNIWQAVGYCRQNKDATDGKAELLFVAIDPVCRRKGICTALIENVLGEFEKGRIPKVMVTVLRDNSGINALLRGMGFGLQSEMRLFNKNMLLYERVVS